MDSSGALLVRRLCQEELLSVKVYQVGRAGHMLMLENSDEFNHGFIAALLREDHPPEEAPRATELDASDE